MSSVIARNKKQPGTADQFLTPHVEDPLSTLDEIPCWDQIESIWYALDVFVPLLDLQQERKCSISSGAEAWKWRLAKNLYAVLGALVTSLTILTVSGILRRNVERGD